MLSVKIDGKVLKSNAPKSDTGRYYPARHSHPWVSFVFVLCTRPVLEARAPWHHATRCSVGGGLFEEPVSEAAWPLTSQIPLAKPDPYFFVLFFPPTQPKPSSAADSFADEQKKCTD